MEQRSSSRYPCWPGLCLHRPAWPLLLSPGPLPQARATFSVSAWDNAPLPGTFKEPHGIAVDAGGNVYVADTGNYRIRRFTADGAFIADWGTEGSSWHGRFMVPAAVAADSAGNIYVGVLWGGAYDFQKFDSTGAFVASWYLLYGYDPVGVAVDGSNNVYIATHVGYGLILKYDAAGRLLTSWQCSSQSSAESDGIAVDPHGYVYVADVRNSVIYKFDLDGHPLASWPHTFPQRHNTLYASDTQLAVDGAALGPATASSIRRWALRLMPAARSMLRIVATIAFRSSSERAQISLPRPSM